MLVRGFDFLVCNAVQLRSLVLVGSFAVEISLEVQGGQIGDFHVGGDLMFWGLIGRQARFRVPA